VRRLVIGCGYLGNRVAKLWRDTGDEVYATTRGERLKALSVAGLRPLEVDVTGDISPGAFPAADTVVFAVGRSGTTMFDVHGTGLLRVLDTLPQSTGRVIYISSTGVYAQNRGEWVDEASPCQPEREGGKACLSAERLLFGHVRGRDAVVLRLAGLYGERRLPWLTNVTGGNPIPSSPDAYLNLIHVEDAAQAVVIAAASGQTVVGRTYNISDGSPPVRREYVELLASRLRKPVPMFEGGSGRGKRVRNDRVVCELGLRTEYDSFREGLAVSCPKVGRDHDGPDN